MRIVIAEKGFVRVKLRRLLNLILLVPLMAILILNVMEVGS
jgi:hypothetical protein